ncbi:MAG TPA: ABC transporter, partial [Desulfobacterales bacterium]|nr:ABC transporter [Desulfobacterales bacterium]
MHGVIAVFRKEIADHFSSYRFVILFGLIAMVSFITSYMAGLHLRESLEGVAKPKFVFLMLFNMRGALFSLVQFVAFFGPLIGIVLGFDAINKERSQGTLIKITSQPIYRDAVINGKFLAGVATISIMLVAITLVVAGFGLTIVGVVPGVEEVVRLFVFVLISIFYISLWLGLAILFSILFKSVSTSALASVALWIFLSFFVSLGASVLADSIAPVNQQGGVSSDVLMKNARIKETVSLFSPMVLYSEASGIIIDPMRKTTRSIVMMGALEQLSMSRFQNP